MISTVPIPTMVIWFSLVVAMDVLELLKMTGRPDVEGTLSVKVDPYGLSGIEKKL